MPEPFDAADLADHGHFIMAMCQDQKRRIWVGTEDEGIYCYDPSLSAGQRWKQFTKADGLGDDNAYALVCDRIGRIWAGHSRSGLSVFDGRSWKHYDQLAGPLGSHVYAMAVSPKDGDVWTATELGLCRYRLIADDWRYYVSPAGVPLANITGITFDRTGNIVVGTQTDGIAIGDASTDFERWTRSLGASSLPSSPIGEGLPTNQINCMLATHEGRIWAGTHDGLAWSGDGGVSWHYIRGQDYKAKLAGRYNARKYDAILCGFDLMLQDSDGSAIIDRHALHVAAGAASGYQNGVHIAVYGGATKTFPWPVDTSRIQMAGAPEFYKTFRDGEFTYNLSGLRPNWPYVLRLHLAELEFHGPGQRKFDVAVNDRWAIKELDLYRECGGSNIGIVKAIPVQADASGRLKIQFVGSRADPPVAGGLEPAPETLMLEDYVSCLAEAPTGRILVGHWIKGLEAYDPAAKTFEKPHDPNTAVSSGSSERSGANADFISCLLPSPLGKTLVGRYGDGLGVLPMPDGTLPTVASIPLVLGSTSFPAFPSPAKAPTVAEIDATDHLAKDTTLSVLKPGEGTYEGADWATRGDWVGRYGSRLSVLCAAGAPFNHEITNDWSYRYSYDIGPNRLPGDSTRHWIHWLRTDDPRVLWDPIVGVRRESEWDDHGEAYPWPQEGPDLWVTVSVPAGVHRLSAYFVNKDGHFGPNRIRDYLVELRPWRSDMRESLALEPLGSARVRIFWGGVYQSFIVAGPGKFYLRVGRNECFNTILSAVMLDKLVGPPTPLEGARCRICKNGAYEKYVSEPKTDGRQGVVLPVLAAWHDLRENAGRRIVCHQIMADQVLCYRTLASVPTLDPKWLAWMRRSLPLVTDEDRKSFLPAMADIYAAALAAYPEMKNIH